METTFFVEELILISDGFNFEYANIESVNEFNEPSIKRKTNSIIQSIKSVQHVGISPITLSDIGCSYMNNAMLDNYNGPCFHGTLKNNDYNVKVIMTRDGYQLAKELTPGALDRFVKVETIGDIQHYISDWQGKQLAIDSNKIGSSGPRLIHENTWLNQALLLYLSNDIQKKDAAFANLSRYLSSCAYNLDACRYWLSECYIDKYNETNDKSFLEYSRQLLLQSIAGGHCDYYKEKLAWVDDVLESSSNNDL